MSCWVCRQGRRGEINWKKLEVITICTVSFGGGCLQLQGQLVENQEVIFLYKNYRNNLIVAYILYNTTKLTTSKRATK